MDRAPTTPRRRADEDDKGPPETNTGADVSTRYRRCGENAAIEDEGLVPVLALVPEVLLVAVAAAKQVGVVLKAPKLLLVPAALLSAAEDEGRSMVVASGAALYL